MKMIKIAIILIFLLVSSSCLFGQTASDSIFMVKVPGGYHFYHGKQRIKRIPLAKMMKPNDEAYRQFRLAQSTHNYAFVIGGAGGFLIGLQFGNLLGMREPNWTSAGIGLGLGVISIPITQSYNRQAKRAVDMYNGALQTTSFWDRRELKIGGTENGVGLALHF